MLGFQAGPGAYGITYSPNMQLVTILITVLSDVLPKGRNRVDKQRIMCIFSCCCWITLSGFFLHKGVTLTFNQLHVSKAESSDLLDIKISELRCCGHEENTDPDIQGNASLFPACVNTFRGRFGVLQMYFIFNMTIILYFIWWSPFWLI